MSDTYYELPLQNIPQTFSVDIAGIQYTMTVYWNNSPDSGWVMDLGDSEGNSIVANIPFVTGIDLLAGLEYLGIGGSLYIYTDGDQYAVPTLTTLGDTSNLYLVTS